MDFRPSMLVHVLFMLWAPFVCVGEVTGTPSRSVATPCPVVRVSTGTPGLPQHLLFVPTAGCPGASGGQWRPRSSQRC